MPYGFEVTDEDAATIRQCIEERTMQPLDDLVEERVAGGERVY